MRAVAVFRGEKRARVVERPHPAPPAASEVLLRVLEVGVCGTDREVASGAHGAFPAGSDFLIPGHEVLAEVVQAGPAAGSWKPGDLATVLVRRPCPDPSCRPCRSGRPDFCVTGAFTESGIKGRHGFMADFLVEESAYLVPVPKELRRSAVLTEPLSIAEKALAQIWEMQDRLPWAADAMQDRRPARGATAVVLGAGPVGLLGAMLLSKSGFRTVVFSKESESGAEARLVRSVGAAYASSETKGPEDLLRIAGNIDVMYEATGASRFSFRMTRCLGHNGIFVFTGIPGTRGPAEIDTDRLMKDLVTKNQVIFGTVNANRSAMEAAVRDLADFDRRWPDAAASLITGRRPPEGIGDALSSDTGIKETIVFNGGSQA